MIAQAIYEIYDPRLALVTITSVVVTSDLRLAKVYWTVSVSPGDERTKRREQVQRALDKAAGNLRRSVAQELNTRFVPELKFFYDDTIDTSEEVERLFERMHEGK